jgi:DNA-binding phage protein
MKPKRHKSGLLKELKRPEYAAADLTQALKSGDQATILLALRDVVEAGGSATEILGPVKRRAAMWDEL